MGGLLSPNLASKYCKGIFHFISNSLCIVSYSESCLFTFRFDVIYPYLIDIDPLLIYSRPTKFLHTFFIYATGYIIFVQT